jgi:hypothetical protein
MGEGCNCWKQRANLGEGSQRFLVLRIREKGKNWSSQRDKKLEFSTGFYQASYFFYIYIRFK